MIECKKCNRIFTSLKGLSSHIRQFHEITSEQYYITYIDPSSHICKECGKETAFMSLSTGFRQYCCLKCSNNSKEKAEKARNTFKSNPSNSENAKKRIITYNQSDIGRANSSKVGKRTGGQNLKTAHKKYDQIQVCETCNKQTKHMLGIGCLACYNRDESHKQSIIKTIQERYGEEYTNAYQVPFVKEKIIDTSLKKYGTSNPGNSRNARIKANMTMRGNENGSACEDLLEEALKKANIEYKKQYKEERYPFLCDFYIPSKDLFIELNIYWSHNDHWYNKNNADDIKTLQFWKQKSDAGHKQYKNAINVWTVRDVEKRKIAKKNKLNYLVIWSYDELYNYIEEINIKNKNN